MTSSAGLSMPGAGTPSDDCRCVAVDWRGVAHALGLCGETAVMLMMHAGDELLVRSLTAETPRIDVAEAEAGLLARTAELVAATDRARVDLSAALRRVDEPRALLVLEMERLSATIVQLEQSLGSAELEVRETRATMRAILGSRAYRLAVTLRRLTLRDRTNGTWPVSRSTDG